MLRFAKILPDRNILHDGKRELSGRKISATSTDILFKDIKLAAKTLKVTINDYITACLATAVKQYFELKGDTKTDQINIVIPANIRFAHYGSWERVKFENKFAPVPLTLPLNKDLKQSFEDIGRATAHLKTAFIDVYATYAMSYYSSMFSPYFLQNWFLMKSTEPYTLAFSNTPGLLKPISYEGKKSKKMQFYFVPSGRAGMALSALSYVDYYKITLTVDDTIMKDPQTLLDLLEKNIRSCYVKGDI